MARTASTGGSDRHAARRSATGDGRRATAPDAAKAAKASAQHGERNSDKEPKVGLKKIVIDGDRYPESAVNRMDAFGHDRHGRYSYSGEANRPGAPGQRKEQMSGVPTKKGNDRDEPHEAVLDRGDRPKPPPNYVTSGDNRGSGASLSAQLNGRTEGYVRIPDGQSVRIWVKPPSDPVKAALARGRFLYANPE